MGSKERKAREFERRQDQILAAAEGLFRRKGVAGVRLEDIAEAIEFSKGIIYLHFQSKEALFAHILHKKIDRLLEMLRQVAALDEPMRDGVRRCLRVTVDFYFEHREYYALIFHVDTHSANLPMELQRALLARKRDCLVVLGQVLGRGVSEGVLPDWMEVEKLALVLWGMLNGILQLVETHQAAQKELEGLLDLAMKLVFEGVLNRKESHKGENHGRF
jgi:AcrR family transcriptional regulator